MVTCEANPNLGPWKDNYPNVAGRKGKNAWYPVTGLNGLARCRTKHEDRWRRIEALLFRKFISN